MVISYSDRLLIAFMILSMVAERVYGVEPSTSSDNGTRNLYVYVSGTRVLLLKTNSFSNDQ